jgi:hypothetical protein
LSRFVSTEISRAASLAVPSASAASPDAVDAEPLAFAIEPSSVAKLAELGLELSGPLLEGREGIVGTPLCRGEGLVGLAGAACGQREQGKEYDRG